MMLILNDHFTFKVLWLGKEDCSVTWEKSENLPPQVIDEFEHGGKTCVEDHTSSRMGQIGHTITTSTTQTYGNVASSREAATRPVLLSNTGYFLIHVYTYM